MYSTLIYYNYNRIFNRTMSIVLIVAKDKYRLIWWQQVSIEFVRNSMHISNTSKEIKVKIEIKIVSREFLKERVLELK